LPRLAAQVGATPLPVPAPPPQDAPVALAEIYDTEVEEAMRALHNRDYMAFGFRPWQP
jgi:hypothetical protein